MSDFEEYYLNGATLAVSIFLSDGEGSAECSFDGNVVFPRFPELSLPVDESFRGRVARPWRGGE